MCACVCVYVCPCVCVRACVCGARVQHMRVSCTSKLTAQTLHHDQFGFSLEGTRSTQPVHQLLQGEGGDPDSVEQHPLVVSVAEQRHSDAVVELMCLRDTQPGDQTV